MSKEGRHLHKIGYEYWRYRNSFGRITKFGRVVHPDITRRKTGYRIRNSWYKYCSLKKRHKFDLAEFSDFIFRNRNNY